MKFGFLLKDDYGGSAEFQLFGLSLHTHFEGDGYRDTCPLRMGIIVQVLGFHIYIGMIDPKKL